MAYVENLVAVSGVVTPTVRLHRLGSARSQEGISRRTVARQLGIRIERVREQEDETSDIPLSVLHKWQRALNLPLVELLVEPTEVLSPPILKRAKMVRVMKTAVSIQEKAKEAGIEDMAERLVQQLLDIMPELHDITAWPSVGKRRRLDEFGQAAERCVPASLFADHVGQ